MRSHTIAIFVMTLSTLSMGWTRGASHTVEDDKKPSKSPKDGFTITEVKKKEASLLDAISEHAARARDLKQKMFVEITAEWCLPCKRLQASLEDKVMQYAFHGTYIVQLDFDEWRRELPDIHVPDKKLMIPAFFEIGAKGVATDHTINGSAWKEDTPENMAPVLKKYFSE